MSPGCCVCAPRKPLSTPTIQWLPHNFAHIAPRYLIALPGCLCLFFTCLPLAGGSLQKPFIYLGKISYGLYVFHVLWLGAARDLLKHFAGAHLSPLTFQLLAMSLALPATMLTGMLSYRYLESPFSALQEALYGGPLAAGVIAAHLM